MDSLVTPDLNRFIGQIELPRPGLGLFENPFFEGDKRKKK